MDKIQLLEARKAAILEAGKEIRQDIALLVDSESFVELSAFSFSDFSISICPAFFCQGYILRQTQ